MTVKTAGIDQLPDLYAAFIDPYFPEAEKKPLKNIQRMVLTGLYKVIYLEEAGKPCAAAFITTYPGGSLYLLDYLAVSKNLRSAGLGGRMLQATIEATGGLPVLIETEDLAEAANEEERTTRLRRNSFYERNGVRQTSVRTRIWGVPYTNWVLCDHPVDEATITEGLRNIYHFMVDDPALYARNIEIPMP